MIATTTGSLALSLAFVLFSSSATTAASIWHVSIDNGPAPSPEDGPPLSATASRDRSLLPIQIGSISGAYFLSILIIGTAIFLIGHRLRRAAQGSPRTLDMEMVKPHVAANAFDPSPVSPTRHRAFDPSPISATDTKITWPSPDKAKSSFHWPSPSKGHKQQASQQGSVVTFDESVIEDDKAKSQREMERLYEAVMEHDAKQSTVVYDANKERVLQQPPELQHLRQPVPSSHQERISSPPSRSTTASPPRRPLSKASKPSPISISGISSHSRTSSRTSLGSFSRKRGIRGLPISPPMGSPDLAHYHTSAYGDEEALTPRYYDPGPPPPTPPQIEASRTTQSPPTSPRRPVSQQQRQQKQQQHPLTTTNLKDAGSQFSQAGSQGPQNLYRRQPAPLPLPLRTQAALGPTTSPQQLPLRSATHDNRPKSTIKATVLEHRPDPHAALRTGGVPATPYSPYMPFTPLTPITPRLVTRQERKRREKEEGRRVVGAEDRVVEEADMWGDAYH